MKERLQKKNILNLIRYYAEHNDSGFRDEAYQVARLFDQNGDSQLAEYIMALMSGTNTFVPQSNDHTSSYFHKVSLVGDSLPLPEAIKKDIYGIINVINYKAGINTFMFEGEPGTGKTETAKQIARILDRELFLVNFDSIIDSMLGQTSKNLASVFQEINSLSQPDKAIILFDEIDAIALDRINSNDLREMGRVTSSVLKGLDSLSENIILIATTNLYGQIDKALARRFDSVINFNRYDRDELIAIAEIMLNELLPKFERENKISRNIRLFKKILSTAETVPYPGQLKNLIKSSVAFSDPSNPSDYLKKMYEGLHDRNSDIAHMKNKGFSVRDIEILTGVSKSQVSRGLQG